MSSKVLALVPAYSHLDWRLSDSLRRVGVPFLHVHGCSDLVRARSRLLCDGMSTGAERFLFIDADTAPTPDDIVQLAESEKLTENSAVSGCYLTSRGTVAAVPVEPVEVKVGGEPRFVELLVAGMGFSAVTRETIESMDEAVAPVRDATGEVWRPYFLPFILEFEIPGGERVREYVPEDYSFWWRVRTLAKGKVWLDTHLAVAHVKTKILVPEGNLDFGLTEFRT